MGRTGISGGSFQFSSFLRISKTFQEAQSPPVKLDASDILAAMY